MNQRGEEEEVDDCGMVKPILTTFSCGLASQLNCEPLVGKRTDCMVFEGEGMIGAEFTEIIN